MPCFITFKAIVMRDTGDVGGSPWKKEIIAIAKQGMMYHAPTNYDLL
jgi:hypothetical protein